MHLPFLNLNISSSVADATFSSLVSVFARLVAGEIDAETFLPIHFIKKGGVYFAATGNRRLFLFKSLQDAGVLEKITVKIVENITVIDSRLSATVSASNVVAMKSKQKFRTSFMTGGKM